MFRTNRIRALSCVLAALAAGTAGAQDSAGAAHTLRQAFELAWERQPEAASLAARQDAADAGRRVAQHWTAEPPALELRSRTDRVGGNHGRREYEVGVAVPLWLPGERHRTGALADAEAVSSQARMAAARLRVAAAVREAWWLLQRARLEQGAASARLASARQLATDVARRVAAGDLAKADQYQADSAVAQAEMAVAETTVAQQAARSALKALTGQHAAEPPAPGAEALPAATNTAHPSLAELSARADASRRAADLAAVQTRSNPELVIAATRERGQFGEAFQHSVTVGLRLPFGGGARGDAKRAGARAEALEAEGQLSLERGRLAAELEAAQGRVDATALQLEAAEKRAGLARELRGFFEKSFRLGESDLPTRLRVELEAAEAERQVARTRVDAAAAVSALRQALGLLPE